MVVQTLFFFIILNGFGLFLEMDIGFIGFICFLNGLFTLVRMGTNDGLTI